MKIVDTIKNKLASWVTSPDENTSITIHKQAHPAQKTAQDNLYVPYVRLVPYMAQYALNHWVYAAVNKVAITAAAKDFIITSRPDGLDRSENHPLLDLIGKFGKPNDNQDSFEFMEKHYQNLLLAGNSYWLWQSPQNTSMPTEVHHLEPEKMHIVAGKNKTIAKYEYWHQGTITPFHPDQITQFKRPNPYNRYYGLSALQVLYWVVLGDNAMLQWNVDFFDDELGIPTGILVVPSNTSNKEMERIKAEFIAAHGEGRRVAIVKADAGKSVWLDAGAKHKDYDFEKGRTLNRKAVLETMDIHLGIMAESATEALAIVAERRFAETVRTWHNRTARKLNIDGINFWPQHKHWQADFIDITKVEVDWRREKLRIDADSMILSLDEMRMREYQLPPLSPDEQTVAQLLKNPSQGERENGNQSTGPQHN